MLVASWVVFLCVQSKIDTRGLGAKREWQAVGGTERRPGTASWNRGGVYFGKERVLGKSARNWKEILSLLGSNHPPPFPPVNNGLQMLPF